MSRPTRLLFPNGRGGHLDLDRWRAGHWTPAVRAAGLPHRSPYALRHTFASFSIAAGVSLFELARLLPDAMERTRSALDTFVASDAEREEARGSFGP